MAVLVVPVAVGVPAVLVFIPPAVILGVAIFTRLAKLMPRVLCLPAVPPMMVDGFVKVPVRPGNSVLAFGLVRVNVRWTGEHQNASKRRACHDEFPELDDAQTMFALHRFSCPAGLSYGIFLGKRSMG